ncbi:hypothetical protein SO802_020635 [Lithocarpus litseifolius]|uniref:Secreted protein n=1 Tax=Lithocarpus litseifolius TaxID=425828 RepID=A0AAW2CCL2_9ROSI
MTDFVFFLLIVIADRQFFAPKLSLVNVHGLNHLLRSEVFAHSDGHLHAVHLILDFTPISDSFQDVGDSIRAGDKRIRRIDVSRLGFLANKDLPSVPWPLQQVAPQGVTQRADSASTLPFLETEID